MKGFLHFFTCTVRYEYLLLDPIRLVHALEPHIGCYRPDHFASLKTRKTMALNSQQGSAVKSEKNRLDKQDIEVTNRALSKHEIINHAHYGLPNTLTAMGIIASDEALAASA